MKRLANAALILFVIFNFLTFAVIVNAQEATDSSDMATAPAKVEYSLAYPGILPDNPLYFLKAARDKLVGFLISDVEKRAEFNLLTSDKRVNAAYMLATRGKDDLAITTLSKSNNYLDETISSLRKVKAGGKNINALLGNVDNAINEHRDIIVGIKSKVDKKYASRLKLEEQRLDKFQKTVKKLVQK